ncbi:MAG: hypothetical protein QNJ09_00135 [Paracoccaceae bacterium]|nr:hypothetical protein [Paracoccaceae bacterium]
MIHFEQTSKLDLVVLAGHYATYGRYVPLNGDSAETVLVATLMPYLAAYTECERHPDWDVTFRSCGFSLQDENGQEVFQSLVGDPLTQMFFDAVNDGTLTPNDIAILCARSPVFSRLNERVDEADWNAPFDLNVRVKSVRLEAGRLVSLLDHPDPMEEVQKPRRKSLVELIMARFG